MQARLIDGGVTTPAGFTAAGVYCGIKKPNPAMNPLDLCLIASTNGPVPAAAVFTTNQAVAAPIIVSREHLSQANGLCGGAVINSGCANACTGEAGMGVARAMAAAAAQALGCTDEFVFVSSTGVIGVPLNLEKIQAGVAAAAAALAVDGAPDATRAIMTTDPFPKSCAAVIDSPQGPVTVGGMAKGSGMIEPRMATMLGFLTTDAKVSHAVLQAALRQVCDETFNAITVDGECSTNDCVLLLASGASGVEVTDPADPVLIEPLRAVAGHLAREIVRGGEGATKLVTVRVTGAASMSDAWLAVRTICNSPLVKTAIHGGDPNWGRLIAAAGRSGAQFVLDQASVRIGDVDLFVSGVPFDERADAAATVLQQKQMTITVDMGTGGHGDATMWTCDFSAEYVKINAEYRT
ncbi:MAG: bifunctional glutamate N-acetyltransferase/amino-acid acetyltransferase ArgJ [Vicinamibacterales bacterium]